MSVLKRLKRAINQSASRGSGLQKEIDFWERWFASKGMDWPEDFAKRLNPEAEVTPEIAALLDQVPSDPKILDVGAGPLTVLGKVHRGAKLSITATDVLAPEYDRLLEKHGLTPPVRTVFAPSESLTEHLPEQQFGLVHCQNALDHAEDPVLSLRQMYELTEPGGMIYLRHYENEAENENFEGLHQWNFTCEGNRFIIEGKHGRHDVSAIFPDVICEADGTWIRVTIRKPR